MVAIFRKRSAVVYSRISDIRKMQSFVPCREVVSISEVCGFLLSTNPVSYEQLQYEHYTLIPRILGP